MTKREEIQKAGVYLIIILALLRFLIYPLHGAVAGKEAALAGQAESYRLKSRLLERSEAKTGVRTAENAAADKAALSVRVYDKGRGNFDVQAEIIDTVKAFAEKKGMVITNVELPEPLPGKHVEEVPVVLKLKGKMLDFIETLEIIQANRRLLMVKSAEISRVGTDFNYSLTITALRMVQ